MIKNNTMRGGYFKKGNLLPVHMVSADHYILWDPDRLYSKKGESSPSEKFSDGCFSVN